MQMSFETNRTENQKKHFFDRNIFRWYQILDKIKQLLMNLINSAFFFLSL